MQRFYERFLESAERFPDRIAAELQLASPSTEVQRHTYAELRRMSEAVGHWIGKSGIDRGARCAILAANSPRWVAAYLGTLASGCVAVPLDTALKPDQAAKLLLDCGASVLFADAKHLSAAEATAKLFAGMVTLRIVLLDGSSDSHPTADQIFSAGPNGFRPTRPAEDELAVILYTSGTTSDPKGVMLTHANLDAEATAVFRHIHVDETDAILGVLPLFHALAQMANLLLPYSAGARVVYLEQLNTTELLRGLREREITLFACVPQFFYLIHERIFKEVRQQPALKRFAFRVLFRLSALARVARINLGRIVFGRIHRTLGPRMRFFITGGSRFDPVIGRDLEALGFDIAQGYGLTESSGAATVTPIGERFVGSVGVALPGVETKVVDAQPDGVGEIALRGGIIMKGYYNRADATAEVLRDGWLYTGDLGRIDQHGRLFITGRQKEVIVLSSGKNIYPEEIEAHYSQSPWIKDICVLGVQSRPGEPLSERLHAVIVPNFEKMRERRVVNAKEVIRFDVENLSAELPSTKRILSYDVWQHDLPRTTTRKLKRFEIQQLVDQKKSGVTGVSDVRGLEEEDRNWMADPVVAKSLEVIRAASKAKAVHPADNLELDLGLDSMERVELVVALEQKLGAKADENVISNVYTVRELVEAVRAGGGKSEAGARAGWDDIFRQPVGDAEVLAVTEHHPFYSRFWNIVGWIVRLITRLFFRLDVSGRENLPATGPYIICPNHQSYIDAPVLIAELPHSLQKQCFYVGTSEIFGSGFGRFIAKTLRLIPVDPDANLVRAMQAGAYGLSKGRILMLYPEGERSIDGEPKTFKKGAAILAVHLKVPVVPVAMDGFYDVWPRGKFFQGFHKLKIAIGPAIHPPTTTESPEAAYDDLTGALRGRVLAMWRPLHQGQSAAQVVPTAH
jgi:long-chain acyl-CoA synthetase